MTQNLSHGHGRLLPHGVGHGAQMSLEGVSISAARVARNDATFREANEAIQAQAAHWNMDGPLPVVCECADERCASILRLTPREYEEVRAEPRWFINVPGHQVNALGWGKVVAEHDGYVIVEKIGEAGEIVEQLDPRSDQEEAAS
jgi:hypothetical protein